MPTCCRKCCTAVANNSACGQSCRCADGSGSFAPFVVKLSRATRHLPTRLRATLARRLRKRSAVAPASAEILLRLLENTGFPPGLVQALPATREAGPLLADADVDHIVFTGSAAVGRTLAAHLGERLVSSTLELSGCDALIL